MAKQTKSKKGVKFDNMSTGQKVIHVFGWIGVVSTGLAVVGALTGGLAGYSMVKQ